MTNAERLKKLETSQSGVRRALESYDAFQMWHAEVASLLSYDTTLRAQFLDPAKAVIREGEFPVHLLSRQPKEMLGIINHAMADLRVAAAEDLHNGNGATISVSPVTAPTQFTTVQPPRTWVAGAPLETEHGLLWFWHHCHYRVRWILIGAAASIAASIFFAGFAAGRTNLFVRLFDVFHETSATAPTSQPSQASATQASAASASK